MKQLIICITVVLAFHVGNVEAAQWMPLDEAEDRLRIRTNNSPEEGGVLCTSHPAKAGKGIHKDGRRLGFLNKKGCKTVGASNKVVLFTREDGDIMVLVDEVPAPHDVDQIEHSSVHDGGWYCAICELDFDTEEDMDEHAEEMGHTHTDHGDSHDEGEEHSNDTEFDSAVAFVGCNYWGSGRSGVNGVQVVTWDECHDAAVEGGYEWFGLNWGGHKKEGKGGCHLSNAALPPVDGSQCQEVTDEAGHYLGHSQSMAIYSQGGVSGAKENE